MKKALLTMIICCLSVCTALNAAARGISTIRDAETEEYLREIMDPIIGVAGLDKKSIKLVIVQSDVLNAFVAGGQNVFLHTGLIMEGDDSLLLQGVIAHELGHIAGGHLIRKTQDAEYAGIEAAMGYILGIGSVLAGAPPEAATAIVAGGQHVAQRGFLKYSRQHEEAADQAALNYLEKLKVSPKGLMQLLEKLWSQNRLLFSESNLTRYDLTHPLSQERINHIQHAIKGRDFVPVDKKLTHRHLLIKAKLKGFLGDAEKIIKEMEGDDTVYGRYTRTVALYRLPMLDKALVEVDALIAEDKENPFFYELKGQMLYENGKVKEAIAPYREALSYRPDSPLLQLELAAALLALEGKENITEAIELFNRAVRVEKDNPFLWRQLGIAYGKQENLGMSYLALAQRERLMNKNKEAKNFLLKAREYIAKDSPAFLRSQDLLNDVEKRLEGKS